MTDSQPSAEENQLVPMMSKLLSLAKETRRDTATR